MSQTEIAAATNQEILRVLHDVVERLERLIEKQDDLEREIRSLRGQGVSPYQGEFITNFTSSEAQAAVLAVSIAPDGAIWMVLADPESLAAQTHEFPPTTEPLDWEIARLIEEPQSR